MTRGILIAGNESSLFSAIAAETAKRVESYASAPIPNRFSLPESAGSPASRMEAAGGSIPLTWNPTSPISARTLVLAAENRLGQINDAILICSPPPIYKGAEALTPEEVEVLVNNHIKGWFFLVRELVLYFRHLKAGSLSMVVPEIVQPRKSARGKNFQVDLLGPAAAASFRAFGQSVLVSSANEHCHPMGFSGCESGLEAGFAEWLFRIIDRGAKKNSGRWHQYKKRGLFRR